MDTPLEIDTKIKEFEKQIKQSHDRWYQLIDQAHIAAGETPTRQHPSRRPTWPSTDKLMRQRIGQRAKFSQADAQIMEQLREQETIPFHLGLAIAELQDAYWATPWPRYYQTTGPNRHIHASRSCGTCRSTTVYEWLTNHSGDQPEAVVEAHGPILCRVCFRDQPDNWKYQRRHCAGSDTKPKIDSVMRWSFGSSGICPICQRHVRLKTNDVMIKHPPAHQ
jgi:hypothetical protein